MADLSKIKLNGTEYDLKDSFARNLLHIINIELTGDTYNNLPVGQLNCSQEELKNYYKNGLCIFRLKKDENTYTYFQISDYDSTSSQVYSYYFGKTLDVYTIYGTITLDIDGGFLANAGMIGVKSDGTCFIGSSRHLIPYITDHSSKGIYDSVKGELDISNIVMNSDLSTVATSGNYNDLTNKPTIPNVPAWALAANKPTYSFSELTSHPTTINDYGITDAYTKTEIDGLVSGVLHYKGTKSTTSALPSNGNTTGDVWHITADGSEWAWDGSNWQELGTAVDLSVYRTAAAQDAIDDAQDEAIAGKLPTDGDAYRAVSIPMGHLDSTSTATVMTATVDGITELRDGVCVWLQNNVIASASGVTLNINSLGAKPIYNSLAGTVVTTTFAKAATYLFVYNSTRVSGGCWDMVYGYDTNTTYSPAKLGQGYAVCSTAATTAAKTASISSYALVTGGIVAIKFENDVPANATLNITSKGAKAIYYKGAAITDGTIKAGDLVTMIYSTYYHVLSINRANGIPASDMAQGVQIALGKADTALQPGDITEPLIVTYTITNSSIGTNPATCDKTYAQIYAALNNKTPIVAYVSFAGTTNVATNTTFILDPESGAISAIILFNNIMYGELVHSSDDTCNIKFAWFAEGPIGPANDGPVTGDAVYSAFTGSYTGLYNSDDAGKILTVGTNGEITLASTNETDPIFTASAAFSISSGDINYWNSKSDFSGSYNDLTDQPTFPEVPAWALEENKPTYTAGEVGALPDSYIAPVTSVNGQIGEVNLTIPAAQVQSDWNATSGMAQILNKPTIPEAETDANVEDMLDSFNLDYISNTTSSNYANGVSF